MALFKYKNKGFYVFLFLYVGKRLKEIGYTSQHVSWLFTYMLAGTIIGCTIINNHCLFYDTSYYLSNPLEIIYVWKGGLASHRIFRIVIIGVISITKELQSVVAKALDYMKLLKSCTYRYNWCVYSPGKLMNSEIIRRPTGSDWGFVF